MKIRLESTTYAPKQPNDCIGVVSFWMVDD
jgi:hypothetical protein